MSTISVMDGGVRLPHGAYFNAALLFCLVSGVATPLSPSMIHQQAARDVSLDCELAEALVRIEHLETRLTAQKHDEMMTNVRGRGGGGGRSP